MAKRWIQKAIRHKGALKEWIKKEHPTLLRKDGEISITKLEEFYRKHKDELTAHRKRQIILALRLYRMRRKIRKS